MSMKKITRLEKAGRKKEHLPLIMGRKRLVTAGFFFLHGPRAE